MNVRSFGYLLLIAVVTLTATHAIAATEENIMAGKAIYERLCVSCHGPDGRGSRIGGMLPAPPRDLTDQAYMETRSDQQLFDVIQQGSAAAGLSSAMQAFGDQLTDQEIWDTVAYVRTLGTQTNRPAAASEAALPRASSTELRIAKLRLSIWPEYDDPRVLVMLRGKMTPENALPTQITLLIPKGADIIGAGMISAQNELLLQPYEVAPGDPNDRLEFTLPTPGFFVEFYYDPLVAGTDKRFSYAFPTTYAIDRLEVDIQQPLRATNFVTDPQPMRRGTDTQGFSHHWFVYRNVRRNETKKFTISYTKTVAGPSITKRQPEPTVADQPPTATNTTMIAVGLLVGAAVVVGGGIFLWMGYQRRRNAMPLPQDQASRTQMQPPDLPAAGSERVAGDGPNFCSNCGYKLQSAYRFCPGCGRALR
jgi:mono/diheme cytochrome c family protein